MIFNVTNLCGKHNVFIRSKLRREFNKGAKEEKNQHLSSACCVSGSAVFRRYKQAASFNPTQSCKTNEEINLFLNLESHTFSILFFVFLWFVPLSSRSNLYLQNYFTPDGEGKLANITCGQARRHVSTCYLFVALTGRTLGQNFTLRVVSHKTDPS